MKGECSRPDCGLKDGLSCEMGHAQLEKCPHFQDRIGLAAGTVVDAPLDDTPGQRLPWTGRAFGVSDMMLVSARSQTNLVSLIGPFKAGKTSFLTALFARLSKTGSVENHSFAGSYTIEAWGRLKRPTLWPASTGPSFPPHTPDTGGRIPSLLHLAFREGVQPLKDVLFTDAPGEWFARWVQNQSADNALGARWIAENATHILFFVDRAALASPEVGKARQDTLALARLVAENRRNCPIMVIWSKSDGKINETVEKPIREKLDAFFGQHSWWNFSVENATCLDALAQILVKPKFSSVLRFPILKLNGKSAFLSYAGGSI